MKFLPLSTIFGATLLVQGKSLSTPPENFDSRLKWHGCAATVLDQGQCGSCYAVSATSVFGDRLCVFFDENGHPTPEDGLFTGNRLFQSAGTCTGEGTTHMAHNHGCKRTAMFISPQTLVSCGVFGEDEKLYPNSAGCNGGEALDAWRFFHTMGATAMTANGANGCTPYTSGSCNLKDPHNNGCRQCSGVVYECEDTGFAPQFFKVGAYGTIHEEDLTPRYDTSLPRPASDAVAMERQVENMQVELMTNGPIHVCIDYFENFGRFFNENPNGIYNSTEGTPKTGGHCLNIIGWGHDHASGLDYWLIKNSWGKQWGTDGLFRFLRGADLAGVESDVWVGCPLNSNCKLTDGVKRMDRPDFEVLDVVYHRALRSTDDTAQAFQEESGRNGTSRGGYWHEIPREQFSHRSIAIRIAHAFEHAFGEPTSPETAIKNTYRVWTQGGVKGIKVRVQFYKKLEFIPFGTNVQDHHLIETEHHHSHDGITTKLG